MPTNAARHLAALARCAAVAKRVEAGESQASIARALGVSRARVSQMMGWGRLALALQERDAEITRLRALIPSTAEVSPCTTAPVTN